MRRTINLYVFRDHIRAMAPNSWQQCFAHNEGLFCLQDKCGNVRSRRISELCVPFCGIANITDLISRLPHKQSHHLVTNCYSQNSAATARDYATGWKTEETRNT